MKLRQYIYIPNSGASLKFNFKTMYVFTLSLILSRKLVSKQDIQYTLGYNELDLFFENEEHIPFDGCTKRLKKSLWRAALYVLVHSS